jgi:hypothetical protein
MKIKFKASGKRDYMGFQWFKAYNENNEPILQQGVHLAYHAIDENHAHAMHNQINKLKHV